MINNLGTPSTELHINFGVLQINTENSAVGYVCNDTLVAWSVIISRNIYEGCLENAFLMSCVLIKWNMNLRYMKYHLIFIRPSTDYTVP